MATRFYFPKTGAAPSSPSVSAGWGYSDASLTRLPAARTKTDTGYTVNSYNTYPGGTSTGQSVHLQLVSDALDVDQTISGTFSFVIDCFEETATFDASVSVGLRVMQGDTSTERGELRAPLLVDSEVSSTGFYTRIANAVAISTVNALAGDRVVIELGFRYLSPSASAVARNLIGAISGGTDLALTSAVANATYPSSTDTPWLELSTTLTFAAPSQTINVTQATETDAAQTITLPAPTTVAVAQASETDIAQAVSKVLGAVTVAVNQATETDLARAIAVSQGVIIAIGQVTESDLAQPIAMYSATTIAVGQVTELDVAQIILEAYSNQTISVGQAAETDAAQVIASPSPITIALAQVSEIDLALAITRYDLLTVALGQASETDIARSFSVVFGVTETWSINLKHPTTGLELTGLGNTVVKFEAYQESTGDWFNSATNALQAAQPTPLALLEDVSGNHNGRYAAAATIGVFDSWMVLHIYWDYDAGDGRGSIRRHAWSRVYYNAGVELLPGMTAAQDTLLVTTIPAAIAAVPAAVLAAATTTPIAANMEQTNGIDLKGAGTAGDKFRSTLVA